MPKEVSDFGRLACREKASNYVHFNKANQLPALEHKNFVTSPLLIVCFPPKLRSFKSHDLFSLCLATAGFVEGNEKNTTVTGISMNTFLKKVFPFMLL